MPFLSFLAQYRNPVCDAFFQFCTYFGQEALVIAIVCYLFWCKNKRLAYQLGLTFFIAGLLIQGLKIVFHIPRPWVLDPEFTPVASALSAATGYSFPSGHTQGATSLFGTLLLNAKKRWQKLACALVIALVMFSRMYLGVHTPKDVLVSFCLSMAVALIVHRQLPRLENRRGANLQVSAALILFALGLCVLALGLLRSGTIETVYAADCIKSAGAGTAFAVGWYIEREKLNFSPECTPVQRLVRFAAGIAVTLALQAGLKPILGASLPAAFIRYMIVVLWIVVFYPAVITRRQ